MKKNILIMSILSVLSFTVVASSFTVFPTQLVFEQPGKVKTLTVVNVGDDLLNTQSTFSNYIQVESAGKFSESNIMITGVPSIMATPVVIQNLAPMAQQDVRLIAIKQNPESEIVYRYYVKNLNQQSIDSTGAQFEIAYGIPVFVLPQHINESYNFSYTTHNGKSFIKATNTGNVHVMLKNVYVQDRYKKVLLGAVGRLLAGSSNELLIPPSLAKSLANSKQIIINTVKAGLINFDRESKVQLTITK